MGYLVRFENLLNLRRLSKKNKKLSVINFLLMYESIFALRYILVNGDSCSYEEYRRISLRDVAFYRGMGMA